MSGREWKPGDVGAWSKSEGLVVAIMTHKGTWNGVDAHDGAYTDRIVSSARPLVVIDPEDREQVNRLDVALSAMSFSARNCGSFSVLQAALREFADPKPPKPDEPTGLGAVVECSDGRVFVVDHVYLGTPRWYGPIRPGEDAYGRPAWSDIPAVKVLSEGVQP